MLPTGFAELSAAISWTHVLLVLGTFTLTVTIGLGIVVVILISLPAEYFQISYRRDFFVDRGPMLFWTAKILKNLFGWMLVILGVFLSLPGIPGQGVLTILIGVSLLDFGKRRLEQKLLARRPVRQAVNGLRVRFGRSPLVLNDGHEP